MEEVPNSIPRFTGSSPSAGYLVLTNPLYLLEKVLYQSLNMSTLATAQLESDDEGDLDFVPDERPKKKRRPNKSSAPGTSATHDDNSDSGSSSSSHSASSARSTQSSRVRRSKESREADEEAERSRRAADAFALMRAEASGSRAQDQPKGAELPETGAESVSMPVAPDER